MTLPPPLATVALMTGLAFLVYLLVGGFLWGAGYQPVPKKSLRKMMELSRLREGTRAYDLGSGFGRIVIEAAGKYGAACTGIEIDPVKCWWSRRAIRKKKLEDRVEIKNQNLLQADLADADVVYLFLWGKIMQKMKRKLIKEMKPGKLVLSYWHKFPGWRPVACDEKLRVYLYQIPERSQIPSPPLPPQ